MDQLIIGEECPANEFLVKYGVERYRMRVTRVTSIDNGARLQRSDATLRTLLAAPRRID